MICSIFSIRWTVSIWKKKHFCRNISIQMCLRSDSINSELRSTCEAGRFKAAKQLWKKLALWWRIGQIKFNMTFTYKALTVLLWNLYVGHTTEVNNKSIRLVLRWRNKSRDLIPVAILLLYEGSSLYSLKSLTKTQPLVSSQRGIIIYWNGLEQTGSEWTDQNKPKITQENTETDIKAHQTWLKYILGRLTGRFRVG